MDVEICRVVAAAVLSDADKVEFTPLTAKERFTALQSGEIDMLSHTTTWPLTRDSALGLNFTGITYYDGQGFLISTGLGVESARELDSAAVCVLAGTTIEFNLRLFSCPRHGVRAGCLRYLGPSRKEVRVRPL